MRTFLKFTIAILGLLAVLARESKHRQQLHRASVMSFELGALSLASHLIEAPRNITVSGDPAQIAKEWCEKHGHTNALLNFK